jgi:cytochrome c oxidase assembly protein subunit 15
MLHDTHDPIERSIDARSFAGEPAPARAWSRRFALATLLTALPLLFFGGTVTTLHAGLAIDGWLVLEPGRGDWFLWAYPIEQWFRDVGTFVEHSHRLLGSAVGLLAIATALAALAADRRGAAFKIALAALACVIGQGILGGLRVLEKSEDLALLHGAFGQLTFAVLFASVVVNWPSWVHAPSAPAELRASMRKLPLACLAVVYAEIVVGAWLRHGGATPVLFLHALLVIAVVAVVMLEVRALGGRGSSFETGATRIALRRGLLLALGAQILLGILAFLSVYVIVGRNPGTVAQSLFPTLHVMGGASLLSACVAALVWAHKLTRKLETEPIRRAESASLVRAELGGAR